MRSKVLSKLAVPILVTVVTGLYPALSLAADNVATMAGIVLSLQHFPSEADKTALAAIVDGDASDAEKTVAAAIAAIQHQVSADDKAALEAIAADEAQPEDLRKLAAIVASVNHMPSAEDKMALTELAGG
jgi:hypothetical protein